VSYIMTVKLNYHNHRTEIYINTFGTIKNK
jgi:hypothetical protein